MRRNSVHIICLNNVENQNFWCIPTESNSSSLSTAIKNGVQEYVRQWHPQLKAWFITYEGPQDEMLANAIPERAFCDECIEWLQGDTEEPCHVWIDETARILQEDYDLIIFRPGEELDKKWDPMSFVTRIAENVMKMAGPEITELGVFARGRARAVVARQLSTVFKIDVSEELIDQIFDAILQNKAKPQNDKMLPADAAKILKCRWPCSRDEVIEAFRKRAHEAHPDKGGSAEAFVKVNLAKEVLLDAL